MSTKYERRHTGPLADQILQTLMDYHGCLHHAGAVQSEVGKQFENACRADKMRADLVLDLLAEPPEEMNGVRPDRYTEGDVNHVLQPVIGWLLLVAHRGEDPPDWPLLEDAIDRMKSACDSEKKWIAEQRA